MQTAAGIKIFQIRNPWVLLTLLPVAFVVMALVAVFFVGAGVVSMLKGLVAAPVLPRDNPKNRVASATSRAVSRAKTIDAEFTELR